MRVNTLAVVMYGSLMGFMWLLGAPNWALAIPLGVAFVATLLSR